MRKLLLVGCFLLLSASMALAGGKIDVQWNCGQPTPAHSLQTGDKADHAFMIGQVKCTAAKGEIAGVKNKDGVGTEFHEIKGTSDRFQGVFVETLANGEKITYTYEGTATLKADGQLESAQNTWKATSGTGAFKGIKASGTCKASAQPDGTTTFDCSGDYSIEK